MTQDTIRRGSVGTSDYAYAPFDFLAPPNWRAIAKLVALKHGLRATDLSGRNRHKAYIGARYEAIRLVYSHCRPLTITDLGRRFNRDRSTIYYALKLGRNYA